MKKLIQTLMGVLALLVVSCDSNPPAASEQSVDQTSENPQFESKILRPWPADPDVDFNLETQNVMVIVFDASGSMQKKNKIAQAKTAFTTYLNSLPKEVAVGGLAFSGGAIHLLSKIQTDHTILLKRISEISADGGTPLGQAVASAYDMLARYPRTSQSHTRYHLLVVTDGEADDHQLLSSVVREILETPVRLTTIGFDIGTDHILNMPGRTRYMQASDSKQLSEGLEKVLVEMEEPTAIVE